MVTAALVGELIAVGTAAAETIAVVANVIIAFAIGKLSQLLGPSVKPPQNIQTLTIRGTIQPLAIIYGEVVTSGVLVWQFVSGSNNKYLWYVIALAGHQCDSITDVYVDSVKVADSQINGSTGLVSNAGGQTWNGKLYIWRFTGASTDTGLSALLAANGISLGGIAANFNGIGVAKVVIRCEHDTTVFQSGAPNTIRAHVKGKRVYDPRLDSTNGGSGTQRLADATTWTWSANPALCSADYFHGGSTYFDVATPVARLGMGLPTSRVSWPFAAAAANICDQTPSIPGSTTQPRYLLGLVLSAGDTHGTNVDKLLATMIGQRIWVAGSYRIYAGAYDSPASSIDDDDLTAEGYSVQGASSQSDLYNQVVATYYDPNRDWQQEPCAPLTNAGYVAEDGATIIKTLALDGVTDEYRAQRMSNVTLQKSRDQIAVVLNLKLSAAKIAPWETFNLTLSEEGWTNKVFRALEVNADLGARHIVVTAKEENSSSYTDLAVGSYAAPGTATPTATFEVPEPPISLVATSVQDGIVLSWTASIFLPPGSWYEIYEYTANTPFGSASHIGSTFSTQFAVRKTDNTTRYYWVLARSPQGIASTTEPSGNGLAGFAVTTQTNLVPDSGLIADLGLYWTLGGGSTIAITTNQDGHNNCLEYVGTGAASAFQYVKSNLIPIVPGTYTLSAVAGGPITGGGTPYIGVFDPTLATLYGFVNVPAVTQRVSAQITIPAGVFSVRVGFDTNNATVANGVGVYAQQIQLEVGSVATPYQETIADRVHSGILINFSDPHQNRNQDHVDDGSTYVRMPAPPAASGASSTSLTQSGTTTTINVGAGTFYLGNITVNANSGSVNPGSYGTYYVYFDDPGYASGAQTYQATTDVKVLGQAPYRFYVGKITTVSGGGGSGGGGSGPCFSGDVRIRTAYGLKRFEELPERFVIENRTGRHAAALLVHRDSLEPMRRMGEQLVTESHLIQIGSAWVPAAELFHEPAPIKPRTVYNLHVLSDDPQDAHYILESGLTAHNNKP